jgi:hypothetical protein
MTGNVYRGVSMGDCSDEGERVAAGVARSLAAEEPV